MKQKGFTLITLILIILGVLVAGGVYCYSKIQKTPSECKPYSSEAKTCPNNPSIELTDPNCEFTACPAENKSQIANPASVYCEDQNGILEIRIDPEGNQYGVCIFLDKSECDEWAFFRGECQKGENAD